MNSMPRLVGCQELRVKKKSCKGFVYCFKCIVVNVVMYFNFIAAGVILLCALPILSAKKCRCLYYYLCRIIFFCCPFIKLQISIDAEAMQCKKSTILIANHSSYLDMIAYGVVVSRAGLAYLMHDVYHVADQRLFPSGFHSFIAKNMRLKLRMIPLKFAKSGVESTAVDKHSARNVMKTLSNALTNGKSVMIFPEGRRSLEEEIADFKKGAFSLSLEHNIPIMPIVIRNAGKVLPIDSAWFRPGSIDISFESLIYPDAYSHLSAQEYAACVREIFYEMKYGAGDAGFAKECGDITED
jgi:1-acyl-sn-glycerol-3-phosphate acyltransferase